MDYDPKYCQEIIDFFTVEHTREVIVPYTNKRGEDRSIAKTVANEIPTVESFASKIGTTEKIVRGWAEKNPDFASAVDIAENKANAMILALGSVGLLHPTSFIWLTKNRLKWKDSPVELRGEGIHIYLPAVKTNNDNNPGNKDGSGVAPSA